MVEMVYHNMQQGANHTLDEKPVDKSRGLMFFLVASDKETIDKLLIREIHRYLDLPNYCKSDICLINFLD